MCTPDVESAEEHRELGRIEDDAIRIFGNARHAKFPAGKPFVIDDKTPTVPEEHLDPVASPPDETIQMASEWIEREDVPHESAKPIVTATKIDRLGRKEDPHARGERQHVARTAATRAAT